MIEFEFDEDEYMDEVFNDYESHRHEDFAIIVTMDGDPFNMVDVSSRFDTPEELDDMGLTMSSRRVLAVNRYGYNYLLMQGFSEAEIVKEFDDYDYEEDIYNED